jgi:hypothetical protein
MCRIISWDEEEVESCRELDPPDWEFDPEGCTEDDERSVPSDSVMEYQY